MAKYSQGCHGPSIGTVRAIGAERTATGAEARDDTAQAAEKLRREALAAANIVVLDETNRFPPMRLDI